MATGSELAELLPALQANVSAGVLTVTTTNDLMADNLWIERRALLRRFEAQALVLRWLDPAGPSRNEPVELRYQPPSGSAS